MVFTRAIKAKGDGVYGKELMHLRGVYQQALLKACLLQFKKMSLRLSRVIIMGQYNKIGEILAKEGVIGEDAIEGVIEEQRRIRLRFGDILVNRRMASGDDIARALSRQHGLEYADVNKLHIMSDAFSCVPESMAKRHVIMPVRIENKTLITILSDPLNIEGIKEVEFYSGMKVHPMVGARDAIIEAINYNYRFDNLVENAAGVSSPGVDTPDVAEEEIAAPIINLVNMLLSEAVGKRASDIHIEPSKDHLIVRFRIDGVLVERTRFHPWIHRPLTSRIKILSRINITERRLPQDGGFRTRIGGRDVDMRVSTLPVTGGEKTVIRILDQSQTMAALEDLGLSGGHYNQINSLIQRKKGIILVTGPTGSGKTTTLYSIINRIKSGMINIVTVEDPVEYKIKGINQVQVKPDIGLTFARCLRSILRQDPDVILIGEIRDEETAEIAFRAAMTGHLVLSTLHTNDAVSTITRLIDIGIPRYIIASTVIGIIAQRLVRRLCPSCKKPGEDNRFIPAGCYLCSRTGYSGRSGVFEIFTITPAVREIIVSGGDEDAIKRSVVGTGVRGLLEDAFDKVKKGITTTEEVYRVIESSL